jgi:hypothetical protein
MSQIPRKNKRNHIVWKVNVLGKIVEEQAITEAGRSIIRKMPNGPKKEKFLKDGSYQNILKSVLDREVMVDDVLSPVSSNGFFWMTKPCQPIVNRIKIDNKKVMEEKFSILLKEKNDMIALNIASKNEMADQYEAKLNALQHEKADNEAKFLVWQQSHDEKVSMMQHDNETKLMSLQQENVAYEARCIEYMSQIFSLVEYKNEMFAKMNNWIESMNQWNKEQVVMLPYFNE